jgi:cell division protein FtsW
MNVLNKLFRGDRILWVTVVLLMLISLTAVYSSSGSLAYKYREGNTEYYLFKHLLILMFGFALMFVVHRMKYTFFAWISKFAIIVAIPLLLVTLLIGTEINDASRWLMIPIVNISFQTSDLAKLALILFVARLLSKKQDTITDLKTTFLPIMGVVLVTCVLILPANLSTAAVLFATCIVLMVIGRISIKYITYMFAGSAVLLMLFVVLSKQMEWDNRINTWEQRIETFINDDGTGDVEGGFQSRQAKIAVATGGFIGKGPGNSSQRNILPSAYADFIYAIIIEEYGFLGGAFIVFLYLVLFYRALKIARKSPRAFATFLAIGCAFSLTFQAMINMAVAVNLLPVTGQPLPLLSMGGTSIWFTSIAVGIILSVSREVEKKGGLKPVAA